MRVSTLAGLVLLVLGLAATAFAADRWTLAQACLEGPGPAPPGAAAPREPAGSCESAQRWALFGAAGFGLALCGGALMLLGAGRGPRPRVGRPQG